MRENRTGVSRYNQGLDAESLNKTLGGLDRIMSASQQRQDLIAAHLRRDRDQAALSPDLSRHQARGDRTGVVLDAEGRRLRQLRSQPMARRAWNCRSTSWASATASRRSAISPWSAALQEKLIALQGGKRRRPVRDGRERRQRCAEADGGAGLQDAGPLLPAGRQGDAAAPRRRRRQRSRRRARPCSRRRRRSRSSAKRRQADIQIKREKAQADMAIAAFKARQWADIERMKLGRRTGA